MTKNKDKVEGLPIIGTITLPVQLMVREVRPRGEEFPHKGEYHCEFAFWKIADSLADVTSDDNKRELGTIGATMGGHHFASIHMPDREAAQKKGTWTEVLIDNRVIWEAINELLATPEAKAAIQKAADWYAEYIPRRDAERAAAAAERKRLQDKEDAAELVKLEAEEAALDKELKDDKAMITERVLNLAEGSGK